MRLSWFKAPHICVVTWIGSYISVERVLADVDTDHGDLGVCCLGMGVLLVMQAQSSVSRRQGRSTAGPSH
jgi:hypothetical protein